MKNIFLSIIFLLIIILSGCNLGKNNETDVLDTEEIGNQLAITTYISQGLLIENETNMSFDLNYSVLSSSQIETRIDQMMIYFERIKIFFESDPEVALDIEQGASSKNGYKRKVSYQLEDKTYTIYYNLIGSSEDNTLDDGEFSLEGLLEYDNMSLEIYGGSESEEDELEMYFETHNESNDNVRIEIENEENESYFEIETSANGVETYSEIRLENDGLDGAIEIYIEENEVDTYYEITKEIDEDTTIYLIEYSIGDIDGSIQISETINESAIIRHFYIEEGDYFNEYTETIND